MACGRDRPGRGPAPPSRPRWPATRPRSRCSRSTGHAFARAARATAAVRAARAGAREAHGPGGGPRAGGDAAALLSPAARGRAGPAAASSCSRATSRARVTRVLGLGARQVIDPRRPLKELGHRFADGGRAAQRAEPDLALEAGCRPRWSSTIRRSTRSPSTWPRPCWRLSRVEPATAEAPEPTAASDGMLSRLDHLSDDEVDRSSMRSSKRPEACGA